MNLVIAFCLLLFAAPGFAQQSQSKKAVDLVSGVDNMPILTDTGTALNMPTRKGQGTAVAMPTWAGAPPVRHEEALSQQLKPLDIRKYTKGLQPDSTRHATPPVVPQSPGKNRRR